MKLNGSSPVFVFLSELIGQGVQHDANLDEVIKVDGVARSFVKNSDNHATKIGGSWQKMKTSF